MTDLEAPQLDDDDRHHLMRVLRLRSGEPVSVADGKGGWRICRFDGAGGLVGDGDPERYEVPSPAVSVAFAPPKGERAEWAVQKLTEVGVDRIIPLVAERGVVRWTADRVPRQLARWCAIARQAAMQSRRLVVASIEAPCAPAELLGAGGVVGGGVVGGGVLGGGVALAEPGGIGPRLDWPTVLVGPEGGWSPSELGLAAPRVAIAEGVLRTETAAVAAGILLTALRAGLTTPAG